MTREEHLVAYRRDADALNEKLAATVASADPERLINATGAVSALSQSATEHLTAALQPVRTRFEQIAVAFPLHCQRIAECAGPERLARWRERPAIASLPAGDLLRVAFHWSATVEGYVYWAALYEGAK